MPDQLTNMPTGPAPALLQRVVESCESRFFPFLGLWGAVARGKDARARGATFDFGLGLGIGASEAVACARAQGECIERYGASVAGVGAPPRCAARDRRGLFRCSVPARAVFLPWVGPDGPALPCDSEGLAYGATFFEAARRAALERIERQALRRAIGARSGLLACGHAVVGPLTVSLFRVAAEEPVLLAIVDRGGQIVAAGAGAAEAEDEAVEKAIQEVALAWLCAEGAILPGVFQGGETLLSRCGVARVSELPLGGEANAVPDVEMVFADASPPGWTEEGGYVVRALPWPATAS